MCALSMLTLVRLTSFRAETAPFPKLISISRSFKSWRSDWPPSHECSTKGKYPPSSCKLNSIPWFAMLCFQFRLAFCCLIRSWEIEIIDHYQHVFFAKTCLSSCLEMIVKGTMWERCSISFKAFTFKMTMDGVHQPRILPGWKVDESEFNVVNGL